MLGFAGEPSEQLPWEAVAAAEPEVVVVMPCGYDADRSLLEAETLRRPSCATLGAAASSRSTPRRPSRAPARGSSTGSSCSPTCCIPTSCPQAPGPLYDVEL